MREISEDVFEWCTATPYVDCAPAFLEPHQIVPNEVVDYIHEAIGAIMASVGMAVLKHYPEPLKNGFPNCSEEYQQDKILLWYRRFVELN